jgi:hypothetical protein
VRGEETDARSAAVRLDDLAQYKAEKRFLDGYPRNERTFYAPRDDLHGLLTSLRASAQHSIVINMYGYTDTDINDIILGKLASAHVYVQMSLDKTQAAGVYEKPLLEKWTNTGFGNSIAIGISSVHSAISHLKVLIVEHLHGDWFDQLVNRGRDGAGQPTNAESKRRRRCRDARGA